MPAETADRPVERKLAAIFAADVAGYSRLMGADEAGTFARLKSCRELIDRLIGEHRGRIFNTAGSARDRRPAARNYPSGRAEHSTFSHPRGPRAVSVGPAPRSQ